MSSDTLFEFEQPMSRTDVADSLREVADKLDGDGTLEFTAGGKSTVVSVPERLQFDVEVERSRDDRGATEFEVEFELEWDEDGKGASSGSLEIS